jgi:hypothetical protein
MCPHPTQQLFIDRTFSANGAGFDKRSLSGPFGKYLAFVLLK